MRRYHEEQHIIERNFRLRRQFVTDDCTGKWNTQRGRYRKRDGLDCGNTRCGICHYNKFYQRDDRLKRHDLSFREQLESA